MIQTVCYSELNNMFFETLRLAVVRAGYLPDVANYQNAGNNNATNYQNAKVTLKKDVGVITEIFNVGSFEATGEKTINKIVIIRANKTPGSIGGWPATQISLDKAEWDDDNTWDALPTKKVYNRNAQSTFTKSFTPDNSVDIEYQIKLITNSAKWDDILSSLIDNVIPSKRFLNTVDDFGKYTDKAVLIKSLGDINISAYNFMERTFRFMVTDVFVQNPQILRVNIPVMSTVNYFVWGNPDMTVPLITDGGSSPVVTPKVTVGYRDFVVTVNLVESLTGAMQQLGNGDIIPLEYLVNADRTITIPYLKGKPVLVPFQIDQYLGDPVRFDTSDPLNVLGDSWDNSQYNGFGSGSTIKLNASLPLYQ